MPETCRDIYDNKSQLLHQVGTPRHLLYIFFFCCSKLLLFRTSADRKIHFYVAVIGEHASDCCMQWIIASCSLSVRLPLQTAATFRFPVHFRHICVMSFAKHFVMSEGYVRVLLFWRAATVAYSSFFIILIYGRNWSCFLFSAVFFSHSFSSLSLSSDLTVLPTADLSFSIWTDFW